MRLDLKLDSLLSNDGALFIGRRDKDDPDKFGMEIFRLNGVAVSALVINSLIGNIKSKKGGFVKNISKRTIKNVSLKPYGFRANLYTKYLKKQSKRKLLRKEKFNKIMTTFRSLGIDTTKKTLIDRINELKEKGDYALINYLSNNVLKKFKEKKGKELIKKLKKDFNKLDDDEIDEMKENYSDYLESAFIGSNTIFMNQLKGIENFISDISEWQKKLDNNYFKNLPKNLPKNLINRMGNFGFDKDVLKTGMLINKTYNKNFGSWILKNDKWTQMDLSKEFLNLENKKYNFLPEFSEKGDPNVANYLQYQKNIKIYNQMKTYDFTYGTNIASETLKQYQSSPKYADIFTEKWKLMFGKK